MRANGRGPLLVLVVVASMVGHVAGAAAASAQVATEDTTRHGLRGDYYLSSGPGAFDFGELRATVVDPNIEFPNLEPTLQGSVALSDRRRS
jgi:hypothetical protein